MTAAPTSWRDRVKVHPAAELFPMMSDAELDELGRDIAENGRQQPLVFWTAERHPSPNGPKEVYLLDGRNRLAAIERAFTADPERREERIADALYIDGSDGARLLYGDDDPWAFVISANLHRRHLTRDQKRELIEKLLKAKPERSDRATAKIAKVSDKTIATVRAEAEARAEIPHVETRVDSKGRVQPAHRPPPAAVVHRSSLPPPPSKEEQIRRLREHQAQCTAAPVAAPRPDGVVAACFEPLMQRLEEYQGALQHVPLDHLARAVLDVMARLGITIELLEEVAAER